MANSDEATYVGAIPGILSEIEMRGYCVLPDVISPAQADAIREILEEILAREATDATHGSHHQRVTRLVVKHPLFLELLCHPLIVAIWQAYLGADMICSTWTGNTLYPGNAGHDWHVDYPYWSLKPPYPPGALAGQTLWLLDDFTALNGGTGAIPGSHRRGHPPNLNVEWPDDSVILTGKRGSVVVADGAWWHCSRPNRSERPRSALLGMYVLTCCVTQEDMRGQLAELEDPSELTRQLLGGNQYQPRNILDY